LQAAGIDSLLGYERLLLHPLCGGREPPQTGPRDALRGAGLARAHGSLDFLAPRLWLIWDNVRIQGRGAESDRGNGTIYENPCVFRAVVVDPPVVLEAPLDRLHALARLRYDLRSRDPERMPDTRRPTPSDAPARGSSSRGPGRYESSWYEQ